MAYERTEGVRGGGGVARSDSDGRDCQGLHHCFTLVLADPSGVRFYRKEVNRYLSKSSEASPKIIAPAETPISAPFPLAGGKSNLFQAHLARFTSPALRPADCVRHPLYTSYYPSGSLISRFAFGRSDTAFPTVVACSEAGRMQGSCGCASSVPITSREAEHLIPTFSRQQLPCRACLQPIRTWGPALMSKRCV